MPRKPSAEWVASTAKLHQAWVSSDSASFSESLRDPTTIARQIFCLLYAWLKHTCPAGQKHREHTPPSLPVPNEVIGAYAITRLGLEMLMKSKGHWGENVKWTVTIPPNLTMDHPPVTPSTANSADAFAASMHTNCSQYILLLSCVVVHLS